MHVTPCSVIKGLSSYISSRNAIFITSGQLSLGSSSFAEQLQLYTLILLPYRDTPRYTSVRCYCSMDYYLTIVSQVCKAFHQMYISYSELQYIVELGGQQLFPVPERDQQLHFYLRLLRDRAHAWFKPLCATISISEQFRRGIKTVVRVYLRLG